MITVALGAVLGIAVLGIAVLGMVRTTVISANTKIALIMS